jgi:hypothetical protein
MPQPTAEDIQFLTEMRDVIKQFPPSFTGGSHGGPPRSASDCVKDMIGNMGQIKIANYYKEYRNRQKDKISQILGNQNLHYVSIIHGFFSNQDSEYKKTIETSQRAIDLMRHQLNSLYESSSKIVGVNIDYSHKEMLRNIGDKLFEIASRLSQSEDELVEMGVIKRLELPADVRTPSELVEVLIKFYMEAYSIYPNDSYAGLRNPHNPKYLKNHGEDLEWNLRRSAEYVRMIYKGKSLSNARGLLDFQDNSAPGGFAMAVYLGLVNLDNASASASASAAIPLPLAANALPVVAAKKKGLFWGGRKTRRRNTKRSKKTRSKRRQTRSRR